MLTVAHIEKAGRTYANIQGISALPKGYPCPPGVNASLAFDLDDPDEGVLDSLGQGLQAIIRQSPEYQAYATSGPAKKPAPAHQPPPDVRGGRGGMSKAATTINSRAKGASAEREFARLVQAETGVRLVRNLEQSRGGCYDLEAGGDQNPATLSLKRFAIEIKRYAAITGNKKPPSGGFFAGWHSQNLPTCLLDSRKTKRLAD